MDIRVKRCLAFLIDSAVYVFLWMVAFVFVLSLFLPKDLSGKEKTLVAVVSLFVSIFPMILRDLTVSVGKLLLGLRVVTVDGKSLSWKRRILRNVTELVIPHVEVGIMFACCRRLGDMLAKTDVVDVRKA